MTEKRRKRDSNIIIGVDAGTTKICAMASELTDGGINILAVSSQASNGLRKGIVVDIEATANSIRRVISDIERQVGIAVKEAYVGISGSHIKGFNSYGAVGIKGREVTSEDVERAIDSASAVYVPLDREILHVLPTDFILDGQDGIKDPVGMAGVRLELKVYIITGAAALVQNLLKCCERAGLEVIDIVLQPLASAEATLTDDERDMGIVLVDIGGGTTDIAVYKEGWLRHTAVLGIGGNHFTNDMSVGLKLPFNEAERVKKRYGSVLPETDDAEVDVVAIDGQVRWIPSRYIAEILQPRCEELLELVRHEVQMLQSNGITVSGAVLTGGSSLLAGIDRMSEVILSMPVRIGYPYLSFKSQSNNLGGLHKVDVLEGEFNNPMYATGTGLVLYGIRSVIPDGAASSSDGFNRILNKMAGWFKAIAGRKH